jgi:hypothetical protein
MVGPNSRLSQIRESIRVSIHGKTKSCWKGKRFLKRDCRNVAKKAMGVQEAFRHAALLLEHAQMTDACRLNFR